MRARTNNRLLHYLIGGELARPQEKPTANLLTRDNKLSFHLYPPPTNATISSASFSFKTTESNFSRVKITPLYSTTTACGLILRRAIIAAIEVSSVKRTSSPLTRAFIEHP